MFLLGEFQIFGDISRRDVCRLSIIMELSTGFCWNFAAKIIHDIHIDAICLEMKKTFILIFFFVVYLFNVK